MAIVIDPTVPADSETPRLGAQRIRLLTSELLQILGFTGTTPESLANPPFTVDNSGNATLNGQPLTVNDPTVPLGVANKEYVDAQGIPSGVATGTNTLVATLSPVPATQAALLDRIILLANTTANTGAVTFNPNGLGAQPVLKEQEGSLVALIAGDINAGEIILLGWDGTQYQLLGGSGSSSSGAASTRNLQGINAGSGSQFTITADVLVMRDPTTGLTTVVTAFNATVDSSTSGPAANGRDQSASFTAGSTVHIYAIGGAGNTPALIVSASGPATGPTLPGTYTSWAYVVSFILVPASTTNFQPCYLQGNKVTYASGGGSGNNGTFNNVLNGGSASSETPFSLAAAVPAIAQTAILALELINQRTAVGLGFSTATLRLVTAVDYFLLNQVNNGATGTNNFFADTTLEVPNLASQNIIYLVALFNGAANSLSAWVLSYTVPNNS